MTRAFVALAALLLLPAPSPSTAAPDAQRGYAGAYGPGVMEAVIRARFANDWWPHGRPPLDWYQAHGAIAAMDCARVGSMAVLVAPDGRAYRVLVADCAGDDGPADRFSRDNIIAELDAALWQRLTAEHGRPLEIELR